MGRRRGAPALLGTVRLGLLSLILLLVSAGPVSASVDYTVVNVNDSGAGSLRQAILDANSAPDFNNILFNIPGGGVHVIAPTGTLLPAITGPVTIDGTSQPAYVASPLIQLDGSAFSCGCDGIVITAPSTVQGLDLTNWPLAGVSVRGKGAKPSAIQDNYIGTNAAGTAAAGNAVGILLRDAVDTTVQRNLVSGNSENGIYVSGKTKGNVIRDNLVGLNWSGTTAIPNSTVGIILNGPGNLVGGPAPTDGNVVSGSGSNGIVVVTYAGDPKAKGNRIMNNLIGTNAAGTIARPNAVVGVVVANTDGVNVTDNVISGNGSWGVEASGAKKIVLAGNRVGTNAAGSAPIANTSGGIILFDSPGARVTGGGSGPAIVSGNGGDGILISNAPGATLADTGIGVNLSASAAIPNTGDGLHIVDTVGKVSMYYSLVSGNAGDGIDIQFSPSNKVIGTTVGLNGTQTAAIPNGGAGIRIAAPKNLVGGAGVPTIVSGNTGPGILLLAPGGDTVDFTGIGYSQPSGTTVANGGDGIEIFGSANNVIGAKGGEANAIVGNGGSGIRIHGGGATGNKILGNLIGAIVGPLPNGVDGVWLQGVSGNLVQGNAIHSNTSNGISVSNSGTHNSLLGNSIFGNGDLGIDLDFGGVTANDVGDGDTGSNDRQNFPVITSYTFPSPGKVIVNGLLNSTANTKFVVEFFKSSACDGSGNGEGESPLGKKTVKTGPSGSASFSAKLKGNSVSHVTATATAPNGSTSEFSNCFP